MKKNKILRNIILVLAALFALGVYYYVTLPAINIHSSGTWGAILVIVAALMLLSALKQIQADRKSPVEGMNTFHFDFKESTLVFKLLGILLIVLIGAYGVGTLLSSPFFNAAKYQRLLTIEEREFTDDIRQVDYKTIPLLDKDSASLLGNRKMGSMVDMVSQFEVSGDYSQINYQGKPVRVTPLTYASPIKWLTNQKNGIPAYILI
ncbi:MAG: CvpA family protein, partial [Lachnospiraceae bacterium]|nr:CvpA family protein [Lachnospiraceae bacterium]